MKKTLAAVNQMLELGIITDYAIGGGMAAMFYMEPVLTYDLDIFCVLPGEEKGLNILAPIYEWADQAGYKTFREHLLIEGLPVQFIPVYNDLVREAVEKAVGKKIGPLKARVVAPEYLVAIMLQTARKKDAVNALKMLEEAKIDRRALSKILKKYGLAAKFSALEGPL
ncbi:MAG: hypothetical protein FD189_1941 [Elusimicrobia bacterium]|nr:MAG: hypothetical protein FD154_1607 [Elusimicrobiota bacterium]KAF0154345.1 MAG: hypothetical protein FD189_1941 [Elusimicrobiota bacterium]